MSLNKWLENGVSTQKQGKPKEPTKLLIKNQKKNIIKMIIKKQPESELKKKDSIDEFLSYILEFKDFLNSRTYLRGDLEKLINWITNLNYKYEELIQNNNSKDSKNNKSAQELLKEVPPKFLDEKLTITLKRFVNKSEINNSDRYYLRKLKNIISDKLKELKIYEFLDEILSK